MKRPTVASLKKVTPENLAGLGAERLAEILVAAAATRPDLKRRLRMELAAEQGADHLAVEIDKRLASLDTSRGKISWRQRPSFVKDLEGLRILISTRLAQLDHAQALDRLWQFLDVARRVSGRMRDKDGELAAVFARAAADLAPLLQAQAPERAAAALADAVTRYLGGWSLWLPTVLDGAPPALAAETLRRVVERGAAGPGWAPLIRQLAEAAGDLAAFQATYSSEALRKPSIAAEVAERLLAAGDVEAAGRLLETAFPEKSRKTTAPDFGWETAWIDYLERAGRPEDAQAARWASFERTLSAQRARDFTRRLDDFQDVEAEHRAFDHAARHPDPERALQFLMDWPALPEAAAFIQRRADDLALNPEQAETWAAKLRIRQPAAAHTLLRKAAAAAFRRRDFATCDRLTQEADAIPME
ncbi:MAG: hypothetical protein JWP35_3108 [Caulobacter sp.]|nr:hypothetical protein [Caulobacter sp.]